MRHHVALAALLAFSGSIAHAAPRKKPKPVEVDQDADEEVEVTVRTRKASERPEKVALRGNAVVEEDEEADAEADDDEEKSTRPVKRKSAVRRATEEEDLAEAPVRVRKAARTRARAWNVAIGPYLWASSVDADVSIGPANVSSGVDFLDMQKHAKYGIPLAGEARYGRFSIYADMMYGVIGLDGASSVGPLMVAVDGTVSSLMGDGALGYLVLGGERSPVSIEARAGMRYQRTSIAGTLEIAGSPLAPPEYIDASADALAGAHVVVRPARWLNLSATGDVGVFGASTNTWSALVDANFRVSSHVLLSLGWRTMTTEKANVSIKMHGPRAAIQLLF